MQQFPPEVREAMALSGSTITCLPVRMDGGAWESAVFFQIGGEESARDLNALRNARDVPICLETEVIKHENGAVALLRVEVDTNPTDPLAGEILLLPGASKAHFETLELLTHQPRLGCFLADQQFRIIHSRHIRLLAAEHGEFRAMLDEAVKHDAMVRLTAQYDAERAFAAVVANYALRNDLPEAR